MMTGMSFAEFASSIAGSRSPPLNPPTAASICAWVPHPVNVTGRTRGNPASRPFLTGPPNAALFARVSGTSSTHPSTAAGRIPR